ncbi:hypothetical protein BJ508DRAFT_322131 [Ascobolus immersus RN42]|uniref:Mid2 domain-containing protein n=1 Tax=Ascobolus immersus RN42 TaxID=1160509 RepID=A0A3N4IP40_ASCIM|nr:hypothetical protein BJ508DRAFT_322131 [Ascobolus immersus RN42]
MMKAYLPFLLLLLASTITETRIPGRTLWKRQNDDKEWSFDYPEWGMALLPVDGSESGSAFSPGENIQFVWALSVQDKDKPATSYKPEIVVELWLWDVKNQKALGTDTFEGLEWKFKDRTQLLAVRYVEDNNEVRKEMRWTLPKKPLGQPDPNTDNSEAYTLLVKEYPEEGGPTVLVSNPFKVDFERPIEPQRPPLPLGPVVPRPTPQVPTTAPTSTIDTPPSSEPPPTTESPRTEGTPTSSTSTSEQSSSSSTSVATTDETKVTSKENPQPTGEPPTSTFSTPIPSTIRGPDHPTTTPNDDDSTKSTDKTSGTPLAGIIGGCGAGILFLCVALWVVIYFRRKARRDSAVKRAKKPIESPGKTPKSGEDERPWYMGPIPRLAVDSPELPRQETPIVVQMYPDEKLRTD